METDYYQSELNSKNSTFETVSNNYGIEIQRSPTSIEMEEESKAERKMSFYKKVYYESLWPIWVNFAETTTLHGPIHITTTKGKLRFYYCIVVIFMSSVFLSHATYLFIQYLDYPILTEIKYGNIDFVYPDITLCPNSPFSNSDLKNHVHIKKKFNDISNFWWDSKQVTKSSPNVRIKRSLLSTFYSISNKLGKKTYQHILDCQVNKRECLENFMITEHPIYYRCFTLRVRPKPPVPAGPTNGIRLVLHRGVVNASPSLMVVEEEPSIFLSSETEHTSFVKDGFFVAFHETNTFPTFPVQSLANGVSVRFGDTLRIALEQTYHEAVSLKGRKCLEAEDIPQLEYVKLDELSSSNANKRDRERKLSLFNYTRQGCITILRQKLTYQRCKCFTESYAIPYSMRDIGQVWCHNLDVSTTKMIRIGETLKCVDEVANLTDLEVTKLVNPSSTGDGIKNCPLRCKRRLNSIHSNIRTKTVQNLDPKSLIAFMELLHLRNIKDSHVNLNSTILKAKDLIFIDIHPVSEMINQIIEIPGYHIARFMSDLGGISGLYVGITLYTIAELIDLLSQFLFVYLPFAWSVTEYELVKQNNVTQRLKRKIGNFVKIDEQFEENESMNESKN